MLKKLLLGGLGGTAAILAGYKIKEHFDEKRRGKGSIPYSALRDYYRRISEDVPIKTEAELEQLQQNALLNADWIEYAMQEDEGKISDFVCESKELEDFKSSPYLLCQNFANCNLVCWLEERGYEDKIEKIAQIPTQATRVETIKALWQALYDKSPGWLDFVAENDVRWYTLKEYIIDIRSKLSYNELFSSMLFKFASSQKRSLADVKEKYATKKYEDLLNSLLKKLDDDLDSEVDKLLKEANDEELSNVKLKISSVRAEFGSIE